MTSSWITPVNCVVDSETLNYCNYKSVFALKSPTHKVQVRTPIRAGLSTVPVGCSLRPTFFLCFFCHVCCCWSVELLLLVEISTLFGWQHGELQILALKMRGDSTAGPFSAWSFSKSGFNWGLKVLLFKRWTNIIHRNQMSADQMIEWLPTDERLVFWSLHPCSLCVRLTLGKIANPQNCLRHSHWCVSVFEMRSVLMSRWHSEQSSLPLVLLKCVQICECDKCCK